MLDLRTERDDSFIGVEVLLFETPCWKWFGACHWWQVFAVPTGWNGAGAIVADIHWRWNGSSQTIRTDYRALTADEARRVTNRKESPDA